MRAPARTAGRRASRSSGHPSASSRPSATQPPGADSPPGRFAPRALAALSRIAVAVLLAAAGFLPEAWATAPAAAGGDELSAPVLLRMTFQAGQVRRYALDFDLTARVEASGETAAGGDARLHLETSVAVVGVFPDGSADVRSTVDRWSLTVDGRPQNLPNAADLAVRQRLRPDGSVVATTVESAPDMPGLPLVPGLPALPGSPARPGRPRPSSVSPLATMPLLPIPARPLGPPAADLPTQGMTPAPGLRPGGAGGAGGAGGESAPTLPSALGFGQLGGYPQRALRVGESIVDSLRLPLAELPLPVTAEVSINRRVTLAGLQPAAGRPAARLVTAVSVPFSAQVDEHDLTIGGAVEARVTQDVDRRTGWPIAADGVVTAVARLVEPSSGASAGVSVRLGVSLRERT